MALPKGNQQLDLFLRMAVGNWTAMLCLEPLVVGSVPAVSCMRAADPCIARDSLR